MKELQLWLLLIFLMIFVLETESKNKKPFSVNYCQTNPCYAVNLACNNKGNIQDCGPTARLLHPDEYKKQITHSFNLFRNNVAGGKMFRNLPKAAKMAKMKWNEELAYFAKLDASRCVAWPQPCMVSPNFYSMGRLAALYVYFAVDNNSSSAHNEPIMSIISEWMKHVRSISKFDTLNLPLKYNNEQYYSTTLLMIEHNSEFGCASLSYKTEFEDYIILTCVFRADNQPGKRLYRWGLQAGVGCKRVDPKYRNLCAVGERYSYDKLKRPLDVVKMDNKW